MVHLVCEPLGDAGLVAVSLRHDPGDERVGIAVRGRRRVVDPQVAERLGRLVDAAVQHGGATGATVQLDLDRLVQRAVLSVARRRPPTTPEEADHPRGTASPCRP